MSPVTADNRTNACLAIALRHRHNVPRRRSVYHHLRVGRTATTRTACRALQWRSRHLHAYLPYRAAAIRSGVA